MSSNKNRDDLVDFKILVDSIFPSRPCLDEDPLEVVGVLVQYTKTAVKGSTPPLANAARHPSSFRFVRIGSGAAATCYGVA